MANESVSSANSMLLDAAVGALVEKSIRDNVVLMPLAKLGDLRGKNSTTHRFVSNDGVAAVQLAENATATNVAFGNTGVEVACTSDWVVPLEITEANIDAGGQAFIDECEEEAVSALSAGVEGALAALMAGFSTTAGSAAAASTLSVFNDAIYELSDSAKSSGQLVCVAHSSIIRDWRNDGMAKQLVYRPDALSIFDAGKAFNTGYVGTMDGVHIFQTNSSGATASAGTVAIASIFVANKALGLVIAADPVITVESMRPQNKVSKKVFASWRANTAESSDAHGATISALIS